MVARAGRKSRLEQLEKAPCAVERMMVVPHRRVVQFARALAKRAGGHSHENLSESYSCRGRVAQLGEHLLCKQHHSFQLLHLFIWFPLFSTTWGICFSFEDNSNGLNVAHKCTVRVR